MSIINFDPNQRSHSQISSSSHIFNVYISSNDLDYHSHDDIPPTTTITLNDDGNENSEDAPPTITELGGNENASVDDAAVLVPSTSNKIVASTNDDETLNEREDEEEVGQICFETIVIKFLTDPHKICSLLKIPHYSLTPQPDDGPKLPQLILSLRQAFLHIKPFLHELLVIFKTCLMIVYIIYHP